MEDLIGRYFFIVVIIFATVMDLVGRWYKNRQRRDRQVRRPQRAEAHEQVDWRTAKAPEPDWRKSAAREAEAELLVPRERRTGLPDFAQILLDELGPPKEWTELRQPALAGRPVEQPMIARVVPKARAAGRDAVEAGRQKMRSAMPSQARMRAEGGRAGKRALGTLRAALEDPAAARRAVVLAEVLGPCRALEPYGRRR